MGSLNTRALQRDSVVRGENVVDDSTVATLSALAKSFHSQAQAF
jgi:hypothetical protein